MGYAYEISLASPRIADLGLQVSNLHDDPLFARRRLHIRDAALQMEGMDRLAGAFIESPATILQVLVDSAIDLCGADSAGISLQQKDDNEVVSYRWVATSGQYASFADAVLPSRPSACGLCIERNCPQIFSVDQRFFDHMGVQANIVRDGLLLPWQVDEVHGTIWIMAHEREEAFDRGDVRIMQVLANFAAMGIRQERQQASLMRQANSAAAAAMANNLAHEINNPLQVLTNVLYLAEQEGSKVDTRMLARDMSTDLGKLSEIVRKIFALSLHSNGTHSMKKLLAGY